jgi:predicted RNA binding protein YcfA (HicA-like mRNA interferase family)
MIYGPRKFEKPTQNGKSRDSIMTFSELVRLLERNGFELIREKGSIRYYGKSGLDKLIRLDYHGSREIPTGTCDVILKAAGLKKRYK